MNVKKEVIAASLLILSIQFITNVAGEYRVTSNALKTFANEILNLAKNSAMLWQRKTGRCPYEEEADDFLWNMANPSILEWDDDLQDAVLYSHGILTQYRYNKETSPGKGDRLDEAIGAMDFVNTNFMLLLLPIRDSDNDDESSYINAERPQLPLLCKSEKTFGNDCVEQQMAIIHQILPNDDKMNQLLRRLSTNLDTYQCSGYSPADYLHALLTYASITEVRAYIHHVYAYYLRYKNTKENPSCTDSRIAQSDPNSTLDEFYRKLSTRLDFYMNTLKQEIARLPMSTLQACDPKAIRRDVTYFEFDGLLENVYIATNDRWLRIPKRIGHPTSKVTCQDIPAKGIVYPEYSIGTFPRACAGKLLRCQTFSARNICYNKTSSKRYLWAKPLKIIGQMECASSSLTLRARANTDVVCRCMCEDSGAYSISRHVVSLVPVESDYSGNMVVTGIRFRMQHGVLYLQIKQGEIGKNFRVKDGEWKLIEDISKQVRAKRLGKPLNGRPNIDTDHQVIEMEHEFQLSMQALPYGSVLTGVKLVRTGTKTLSFEAIGTPYDPATGQLDLGSSKTKSENANGNTKSVKVQSKIISLDTYSTLPYLEGAAVETTPPRPLAGIGAFAKKINNQNGIALKLISLNYAEYMSNQ